MVSLRWLSAHLAMGHFTRVNQAKSQINHCPEPAQERIMRRLLQTAHQAEAERESGGVERS
jgi:hypothetical protein